MTSRSPLDPIVTWSAGGDARIAAATASSLTSPAGSALPRHAPNGLLALRSMPDAFQVAGDVSAAGWAGAARSVLRSTKDWRAAARLRHISLRVKAGGGGAGGGLANEC